MGVLCALAFLVAATATGLYDYTDAELTGPEQPISFSHALHAGAADDGGLAIPCQYCHTAVDKGPHATLPSVSLCMGCHAYVSNIETDDEERKQASAAEIQKIRDYCKYDGVKCTGESIPWVGVHYLPEHVQFKHHRHVRAGVQCQECHGPVETMKRVYVTEDTVYRWPHSLGLPARKLEMGWCLDCHQQRGAWVDCVACHY